MSVAVDDHPHRTSGRPGTRLAVWGPPLDALWRDRRLGTAVAVGAGALWALVAGSWMPRGPLTTAEALWSMAISIAVGAVAGIAMRSRWAMAAAPVTFALVIELVRIDIDGPTVDRPAASFYGLLAFIVGRGFHGLVSLLPMLLGAAAGAGLARQLTATTGPVGRRNLRMVRRAVAGLTAIGLLLVAAGLARPVSTDSIVDANGVEIPGSIADVTTVEVNGRDLGMMIRSHDVDNPVLLFLAGGPGGSEIGSMRNHLAELEQHFTVVTWDQRGAGTSYAALDPTETVTLDGYVDDTIDVTNHLRHRFGQDQIYLLGQSWGTTLGVLAVRQRPELYRAFVGTGQMVSPRATDRIFYDDTLAWARGRGDGGLVDMLVESGPPPYDRMLDYETVLSHEHDVYPYDRTGNSEGAGQMSENLVADEYALIDEIHLLGAFMDTFSALYPHLQEIDFRETAIRFDIPMYFVQGAHEAGGRAEIFADWYPMIEAPTKDLVVLDSSGHRPLFEQPDEFVEYMVGTVLADARFTTSE